MSKHEILSWTSIASSATVIFFYVLFFFGMPGFLAEHEASLTKIFVNTFWIVLAIELLIGLTEHRSNVDKDERDYQIEAFGHKFAYSFVMVILVIMLVQLFLAPILGQANETYSSIYSLSTLRHVLFLTILGSSLIKRITMVYHYRKLA